MSVWSQTNYWDRLFIAFAVDNNLKLDGLSEYFQASNPFLGKTDEWLLCLCSGSHWRHDTPQCSVIHSQPGCCESCELEATGPRPRAQSHLFPGDSRLLSSIIRPRCHHHLVSVTITKHLETTNWELGINIGWRMRHRRYPSDLS